MNNEFVYNWIPGNLVDDNFLQRCSELYSNHYGKWSANNPNKLIGNIKISKQRIRDWIKSENSRIAYCENNGQLIGYAFCIQVNAKNFGIISWVTQLVVHDDFRKKDVAKKILFSIWGLSQHNCWGLVTANPYAVRALEKATRRRAKPLLIKENSKLLFQIGKENISYIHPDTEIFVNYKKSVINTKFFVDHSKLSEMMNNVVTSENKWLLGELSEGWEWFAFTFNNQETISLSKEEIEEMLKVSDDITRHAYAMMNFDQQHKWTSQTIHEIQYILKKTNPIFFADILDIGCGVGRHAIEFAKMGYNVLGIDYVSELINKIPKSNIEKNCQFQCIDFRFANINKKFDIIIALYDVIGSYANSDDNLHLIKNIYNHLRNDGYAIISVMNLQYLKHRNVKTFSVTKNPDEILKIKASSNMQTTGEVFNLDHLIVDDITGVVYRKEIFNLRYYNTFELPEELLVRDKRYLKEEIENILLGIGFKISESKYVKLGKWDSEGNQNECKEILLILQK